MIFDMKSLPTFCQRGMLALGAFLLVGSTATTNAQTVQRISSTARSPRRAELDSTDTSAVSSSSLNALPAAPEPAAAAADTNNQQGNSQYPHYGTAFKVSKLAFELGGGFSLPTGSTKRYQNVGWNVKGGGGYRLTPHFGAMLDYEFDSFGVPTSILNQVNQQGGGSTHLWSLTLNPFFDYKISGKLGGYVTGGGGFYRKVVNFTQPFNDNCAYYDPFYGCIPGTVTQTVAHFSNNAGGLQFGTGLTYSLSSTGNLKLFGEARYVWVDNQPSANSVSGNGYAPTNFRTEYIPVTFGIRF